MANLLMSFGFTRLGRRKSNGIGTCPPGWPNNIIPWDKYQGATRSELKKKDCTKIIISLLKGSGYNPAEHIDNSSSVALASNVPNIEPSSAKKNSDKDSSSTSANELDDDPLEFLSEMLQENSGPGFFSRHDPSQA